MTLGTPSMLPHPWNKYKTFVVWVLWGSGAAAVALLAVLRSDRRPGDGAASATALKRATWAGAFVVLVFAYPAFWVLKYVAEDAARVKVLALWGALLAAGLPLMQWLARSGTVPNIVGEGDGSDLRDEFLLS